MREIVNRLGLTGEAEATLHVALLRELVQGRPVTLKRLAASLNWTTDQVVQVREQLLIFLQMENLVLLYHWI